MESTSKKTIEILDDVPKQFEVSGQEFWGDIQEVLMEENDLKIMEV